MIFPARRMFVGRASSGGGGEWGAPGRRGPRCGAARLRVASSAPRALPNWLHYHFCSPHSRRAERLRFHQDKLFALGGKEKFSRVLWKTHSVSELFVYERESLRSAVRFFTCLLCVEFQFKFEPVMAAEPSCSCRRLNLALNWHQH